MPARTSVKYKRTRKKKSKTILIIAILFAVAVYLGINMISGTIKHSADTETVLLGTAEDKMEVDGYIIRGEYAVNAPESGIISFRSDEGKRVSKGSTVAVVYTGEVSDDVKNELSSIHERMNEIEGSSVEKNLYAGDSVEGTSQLVNDIEAVADSVYQRDTSNVPQYKDDIIRLVRKKTDGNGAALTTYEQLTARKKELESSISGSARVIYAPISGVLCSQTDGYEEYFGISCLGQLTPEYLKNAPKLKTEKEDTVTKDHPCMKLINNYEWFVAANVDEKWAEDLKVNQFVSIRFPDISDNKLDGTIYKISEPSGGKVALVVRSSGLFNGMYNLRNAKVEIIRKTYRGFKVSKEAIHIDKDGVYYVFVNSEGVAKRRNVDILYSDEYYAIIKEDNFASNNLLLYDEVIVSGNVEEGEGL